MRVRAGLQILSFAMVSVALAADPISRPINFAAVDMKGVRHSSSEYGGKSAPWLHTR
jgi:hypothetical protein